MLGPIALVVSYFSGPMLNFGDFSRYGKSFGAVKRGNVLGLPVNGTAPTSWCSAAPAWRTGARRCRLNWAYR
jgi:cytosine/uracil/thiamine/allantoin permease